VLLDLVYFQRVLLQPQPELKKHTFEL
jgi:hypothetical protein